MEKLISNATCEQGQVNVRTLQHILEAADKLEKNTTMQLVDPSL